MIVVIKDRKTLKCQLKILVDFEMPSNLSFSSFDAFAEFKARCTESHVEPAGNYTMSYKSIGKNVFNFERNSNFVLLEKVLRGVYIYLNFVSRANNSINSFFPNLHTIQFFLFQVKSVLSTSLKFVCMMSPS